MSNTAHNRGRVGPPRQPPAMAQMMYCHPCTKELADVVRPHLGENELPPHMEVPQPTPAYTTAVFMVQSLPVAMPVCFRHFIEATSPTSSLLKP